MRHTLKNIDTIVIHCSATKETSNYTFDSLLKDHKVRGFKTCGYHRYIKRGGEIFIGRQYSEIGAHAGKGNNTNSIGICYEGGLDANSKAKDTRTKEQKEKIIETIKEVIELVSDHGGKIKRIIGHRDLSPDLDGDGIVEPHEWIKQCPCFEAIPEYKHLLNV